jgi:hypothetical protein
VRRWKRRGPHAERPGSVGFLGAEMECFAVVSLDIRDRHSGVWIEGDSSMVEELEVPVGVLDRQPTKGSTRGR